MLHARCGKSCHNLMRCLKHIFNSLEEYMQLYISSKGVVVYHVHVRTLEKL